MGGVIEIGPAVGKTAAQKVQKVLASIASSGVMPKEEDSNGPVAKAGLMAKITIKVGLLDIWLTTHSRGVHRQ